MAVMKITGHLGKTPGQLFGTEGKERGKHRPCVEANAMPGTGSALKMCIIPIGFHSHPMKQVLLPMFCI